MGGFTRKWQRMTSGSFALLTFLIPNLALAQAPKFSPSRLPWQTPSTFVKTPLFDNDWARVVSDTQQLLDRLSTPSTFRNAVIIDAVAQAVATQSIWATNRSSSSPPAPKPPSLRIAAIHATLAPVEYTSRVAAESRDSNGVLVGMKFHWVD
ncbi:MAG TPA: hypothetical protein PK156_07260 [Polyangium sp.]|nr:hypothetical protein [Polyangium sp.]